MNEVSKAREEVVELKQQAKEEGFAYYGFPLYLAEEFKWAVCPTRIVRRPVEVCDWMPPIMFGRNKKDFPDNILASVKWADE